MIRISRHFLKNRTILENIIGILAQALYKTAEQAESWDKEKSDELNKCETILESLVRTSEWLKGNNPGSYQTYLYASAGSYEISEKIKKVMEILDFKEEIEVDDIPSVVEEFNFLRDSIPLHISLP